jgi:RNA polymerase sigma factor (sigma-70 family)
MDERSDEQILTASLREPALFGILVDRYEVQFLKTAFGVVRDRAEAEDIVQETFTKMYLNGARFKPQPGATFKSWAYRILMNTAFTHYQKIKKTGGKTEYLDAVQYDEEGKGPSVDGRDMASVHDAKAVVAEVIAAMPEHLAKLLKLYYLDDKSYKDIAEEEGISMSTLKMRLFRAKRIFKKLADE